MDINQEIKRRREEIGLTDTEAASQVGLSIHEYTDIEQHADEIFTLVKLNTIKRICELLQLDIFDLFKMQCAFCEGNIQYLPCYSTPRNRLIRKRRLELGITEEELGERLGFEATAISNMERAPHFLETWPFNFIKELSTIINVPIQILMGIGCKKCGR